MTEATLWIVPSAVRALMSQPADESLETGGLLLGYGATDNDDVVVLDVIGPGPEAVHTETGFEPDQAWQEKQLASRYRATDGLHSYVGDWHTHPQGRAVPSRRDLAVMRQVSRYTDARLSNPTMVIISFDVDQGSLRAWRWDPPRLWRVTLWSRATEMHVRRVQSENGEESQLADGSSR